MDAGTAIAVVLPSSVDGEIVVAGGVFVHATAARLVSVLQDVERLESGGGFIRTKRLSEPPRLSDFAGFQLPPADVESLRDCRPGRCEVKLGQSGFDLAREGRLGGARRNGTNQRPCTPGRARLRAGLPERRDRDWPSISTRTGLKSLPANSRR